VLKIINESHEQARQLLMQHRKELDALAQALLKRETLDQQEILEVTGLPAAPALETKKIEPLTEEASGDNRGESTVPSAQAR
jgi:cell division protease FtsH